MRGSLLQAWFRLPEPFIALAAILLLLLAVYSAASLLIA